VEIVDQEGDMSRIAIVTVPYIRTLHHAIMAYKTMTSLCTVNLESHVVDKIAISNALEPIFDEIDAFREFFDCWVENDRNVLAHSWNRGVELAFERGNEYALVINLDLVFHPRFLVNIVQGAKLYPEAILWSGESWAEEATLHSAPLSGPHVEKGALYSCFMVDNRLFQRVGKFDENLKPAYHEDSDMIYRIGLASFLQYRIQNALFFHHDRTTLIGLHTEGKTVELDDIRKSMDESMEYYFRKWGGLPGCEVFKTPFNSEAAC
jgi:hypothetical protein